MKGTPMTGRRLGTHWYPRKEATIRTREEDDVWVTREELRTLYVCTRFTTKRFFPDAYTRLNMILNVIRL